MWTCGCQAPWRSMVGGAQGPSSGGRLPHIHTHQRVTRVSACGEQAARWGMARTAGMRVPRDLDPVLRAVPRPLALDDVQQRVPGRLTQRVGHVSIECLLTLSKEPRVGGASGGGARRGIGAPEGGALAKGGNPSRVAKRARRVAERLFVLHGCAPSESRGNGASTT